jgi:hypothetical protein
MCNQKGREASKGRSRRTQRVLTPNRPLKHARSDRARTNIHTATGQHNRRSVLRLPSVFSDHICITNMPNLCKCHKTDTENTSQTKSHSFIFHIRSPDSTSSHTSSLPKIANSEALVLYISFTSRFSPNITPSNLEISSSIAHFQYPCFQSNWVLN